MANPDMKNIPADTITLIASAVTGGIIHKIKTSVNYKQTFRVAKEPAEPAPTDKTEFVPMFIDKPYVEEISSQEPIDIYVLTDVVGKLRLDL